MQVQPVVGDEFLVEDVVISLCFRVDGVAHCGINGIRVHHSGAIL